MVRANPAGNAEFSGPMMRLRMAASLPAVMPAVSLPGEEYFRDMVPHRALRRKRTDTVGELLLEG
jgi:hypothetical protein